MSAVMRPIAVILAAVLFQACAPGRPGPGVRTGLDVLVESGFAELQGKRVGLITNRTGKDRLGRGGPELLAAATGVTLVRVFSPEHGFTGASEENAIASGTIRLGGKDVALASLYAGGIAGMRPKPADLADLDVLIFDIQDIGARFYTYLASMAMALEEASRDGLAFLVLDRPNPIGGEILEGPILDDPSLRQVTPTAYFPVPVRHGLTAGEMAMLHNAEVRHSKLTVIRMKGWRRRLWYDETGLPWIAPSPNMPDIEAAALYPGIGMFEASNLSVGRGTPIPFRWIGAPGLDSEALAKRMRAAGLPGIEFRPEDFTPSKSNYAGQACRGLRMKVTDRDRLRPLAVFAHLAAALRELYPGLQWRWEEARRMTGTDDFRRLSEAGAGPEKIIRLFDEGPSKFGSQRKPFLLY